MQEFRVLKCIECETFQVDIVKKAKKWMCKVCGQKQSVKYVYETSYSSKECREKAQDMNINFHQKETAETEAIVDQQKKEQLSVICRLTQLTPEAENEQNEISKNTGTSNKWSRFIAGGNENDDLKNDQSRTVFHQRSPESSEKKSFNATTTNPTGMSLKTLASSNRSRSSPHLQNPSNSKYSIYNHYKPASPPKLIDLHKKPKNMNLTRRYLNSESPEPKSKKLKSNDHSDDDDFELSQDDLSFIDGLK